MAAAAPLCSFGLLSIGRSRAVPPLAVQNDAIHQLKLVGLYRMGLTHTHLLGADLCGNGVDHVALEW